jgi:hypothetical protein
MFPITEPRDIRSVHRPLYALRPKEVSWTARTPQRRSEWPPKYLRDESISHVSDTRNGKETGRNVLGSRMHNDIRAMRERILQPRRPKRRIHKQQRTPTMCLFGIILDIVGSSERIDRSFEVDNVSFSQFFGGAVEGEELDTCETGVDGEDGVGTVVSSAYGDFAWFEPCLFGVLVRPAVKKEGRTHVGCEDGT